MSTYFLNCYQSLKTSMQIRLKSQALFASVHAVEFPTLRCANHTVNNDLSRLANGL